jgi:hypothetical protein
MANETLGDKNKSPENQYFKLQVSYYRNFDFIYIKI